MGATAGSSGVPGDPGALRGASASFGGASGHLDGLAGDLSSASAGGWSGVASVACAALCDALATNLERGSDAFRIAALALRRLADEIEAAQEKAAAALVAAAEADAAAQGLGERALIEEEPAPVALIGQLHDEASGQRAVALAARADAEAAALVAAGVFADVAGMAPEPPPPPQPAEGEGSDGEDKGWLESAASGAWNVVKSAPGAAKDGYESANSWIDDRQEDMDGAFSSLAGHLPGPLQGAAEHAWDWSPMSPKFSVDFAQGVGDWGVGLVEAAPMLVRLTPQYGMIDPRGHRQQQQQLADGMSYAWDNKGETFKTLVGWNHVENGEPGRMAGQAAPDIALAILTGGGSAATKAASTSSKVLDAADDVSDLTRVTRRLDDFPALTPEQQLAAREWRDSLPTLDTPTRTPANRYEIEQTGPANYEIRGGGTKINADGFRPDDALALEAKHVGSPDSSPYVPGSKTPDFIRDQVMGDLVDELERYRDIARSGDTPMRGVEVITNDPRAVPNLERLMNELGVPGRVVVRP
jgi:hypothetical protein